MAALPPTLPTFQALPHDPLNLIAYLSEQPHSMAQVSKGLRHISDAFYKPLWVECQKKWALRYEVQAVSHLASYREKVKAVCIRNFQRAKACGIPLIEPTQWISNAPRLAALTHSSDAALNHFFAFFADSGLAPATAQDVICRDGDLATIAKAIVDWMEEYKFWLGTFTTLDFSNQNLTQLPMQIGSFTGLKTLNLSGNQLEAVPFTINQCSMLELLDLSNNRITSLSAKLFPLTALQTLNLSGNQLTAIPSQIGGCRALGLIDLSRNRPIRLPPEVALCPYLYLIKLPSDMSLYFGEIQQLLPPRGEELPIPHPEPDNCFWQALRGIESVFLWIANLAMSWFESLVLYCKGS